MIKWQLVPAGVQRAGGEENLYQQKLAKKG